MEEKDIMDDGGFGAAFEDDAPAPDEQSNGDAPAQPAAAENDEGQPAANYNGDEFETEDAQPAPEQAPQGGEQAPAASEDEELRKKAHGYDSMLGRLQKEREERKRLEDRLAQLEQLAGRQAAQPQQAAPASTKAAEIPDEIKDDFDSLSKENPRVAALLTEDTPEAKRLRSALAEYGREYVEEKAEVLLTRRELEAKIATVESHQRLTAQEQAQRAFFSEIGAKHPDFVAVYGTPEHQTYMAGVSTWVESKPYSEAVKLVKVIEQGTPAEIVALLDKYKSETQQGGQATRQQTQRDPRAAAAAAVPARPSPMPRQTGPKDSFDAGWDMVPDQKGR